MYDDAELALRDFVDSFEKYPYEKYSMDYVIYENNLSTILKSSLKTCASLSDLGKNIEDITNRINWLSTRPLCGVKNMTI